MKMIPDENLDVIKGKADEGKYHRILEEALPFIAQVAGGEVVMYNREGRREKAFDAEGNPYDLAVGGTTQLCGETMREGRSSMGHSLLSPECLAVRIPLSDTYGLAFNNKRTVMQRTRLLDNARKYQYARYHLEDIIGDSPKLMAVKDLAQEVAKSLSTVLIYGETGTGKELFAQAIHNLSSRAANAFVAINCGALPANLVESSLFGYVEGAFTGAKKKGMPGVFEQANKGTLFLDEISEMPLDLQVKLLRVLQEREVIRIGDTRATLVDVRIIASTNRPLWALVEQGQFRADLFYRLNVVDVHIPPLRERKEDLPMLTCHFTDKFSQMMGKSMHDITSAAMQVLGSYSWPGNVRELQNCIEHVFNVSGDASIRPQHLPQYLLHQVSGTRAQAYSSYQEEMHRFEGELLARAMRLCNRNKTAAAKHLGMNRTTLWRLLKNHDLLRE